LTKELPLIIAGGKVDLFGPAIDSFVCVWACNALLGLTALRKGFSTTATLAGLTSSVSLNIGREPGTAMPAEWGASGARLSLPVAVRFSDEEIELGLEGEDALGGRWAKRLYCDGGSFVGLQGEVNVPAAGGAWKIIPSGKPGISLVRFFIEFPEAVSRNDVTLPASRIFFSSSCWDSEEQYKAAGSPEDVMEGPGGVQLLKQGGVTYKQNSLSNAYGLFGDFNFILGRYSMSPMA
jgi:hypothetical protein